MCEQTNQKPLRCPVPQRLFLSKQEGGLLFWGPCQIERKIFNYSKPMLAALQVAATRELTPSLA